MPLDQLPKYSSNIIPQRRTWYRRLKLKPGWIIKLEEYFGSWSSGILNYFYIKSDILIGTYCNRTINRKIYGCRIYGNFVGFFFNKDGIGSFNTILNRNFYRT